VEAGVAQVGVAPEQLAQLVGTQAGEQERGDRRVAVAHPIARVCVEGSGRVEQRLNLICAVEVDLDGALGP
jgi:hypothetical protein